MIKSRCGTCLPFRQHGKELGFGDNSSKKGTTAFPAVSLYLSCLYCLLEPLSWGSARPPHEFGLHFDDSGLLESSLGPFKRDPLEPQS